jgi:SAM-dependent methyltransferase
VDLRVSPSRSRLVKHELASAYDRAAPAFADDADPVYVLLNRPLADALARLSGRTLDVAAGSGALGRLLPATVAVDISSGQLAHNPTALKVRGDAEWLPFRDGAFAAAGCAFGINHFPDPVAATAEMGRVAPVVGLLTWVRPEPPYAPKQIVNDVLVRRAGRARTDVGALLDDLGNAVGSAEAVGDLLRGAGLRSDARVIEVDVPWPGVDAWLAYRLGIPTAAGLVSDDDQPHVRREVAAAIATLSPAELLWRARLVLGLGRRV